MKKILLIDDHDMICQAVVGTFKGEFDVTVAHNGAEMRKCLEQDVFSLAMVDMKLGPWERGIDLLPEINAKGLPFVMLSADDDSAATRVCMALGARAFINKLGIEDWATAVRMAISNTASVARPRFPIISSRAQSVLKHLHRSPSDTVEAIASAMHVTPDRVSNIIKELYQIFKVTNTQELIDEAIRRGFKGYPQ
jgi:DNA-binding NarL/FixJ family response regulator